MVHIAVEAKPIFFLNNKAVASAAFPLDVDDENGSYFLFF